MLVMGDSILAGQMKLPRGVGEEAMEPVRCWLEDALFVKLIESLRDVKTDNQRLLQAPGYRIPGSG